MQMIAYPNCGKLTGFKRALGFGTFFVVLLTCGLSPAVSNAENGVSTPVPVVYSVAQIDAHRNNIPTGSALTVRGIYDSPHVSGGWAPSTELGDDGWVVPTKLDPCSTLLYGGTVRVQHGEADPRDYCRFSVILQDENTSQIQYLECVMRLEGARAAMHKYAYGDRVQAHGRYASSLDFHIMPKFLGVEVGVPVLDNCSLGPLASQLAPGVSPATPAPENIMRAINAYDSSPQNRSKPYPVDADLEGDVRRALSTTTVLKNAAITAVSLHREVTLSGTVVDESSRELAEEIASQVPGVAAVHDNLTIGAGAPAPFQSGASGNAPAAPSSVRSDGQVEMDVLHALGANSALKDTLITAATAQGEVTLSGTVPNESCRELAELIAKYVPGVAKVHNNLTVGIPQGEGNGYGPGYGWNAGGGVYQVGGRISAPVPIYQPEAEFSDEARRAKYQGVCIVALIVDVQGNPQKVHVVRALGKGLDEKAVEAVREYRFKPAMLDGKTPVPTMITVEVDFHLQ